MIPVDSNRRLGKIETGNLGSKNGEKQPLPTTDNPHLYGPGTKYPEQQEQGRDWLEFFAKAQRCQSKKLTGTLGRASKPAMRLPCSARDFGPFGVHFECDMAL
jgi:hypothetical protein